MMRIKKRPPQRAERRGVAAVEFAFMAPVLITIVLGIVEVSRVYDSQNLLEGAAREGARFSSIDRSNMLQPGQSSNDKVAEDVKNYLAAQGIPKDGVNVSITDHANPGQPFSLDDPANDLRLFDLTVAIDFSDVSFTPISPGNDFPLSAKITFRNGRANLAN